MAKYEHLSIYKSAFDMAVYFENLVKGFSRYHKYSLGSELRALSREILKLIVTANNLEQRKNVLLELRLKVEELKVVLRLCQEARAFNNFNSFEFAVKSAVEIGRQNEGWLRSMK